MTHISGLPRRAEVPVDARDSSSVGLEFDRVIYRLGLHALPVPGLPASFGVDDVRVDFVEGPILAQRTEVRQRHGLPFVFDKHMSRSEAGDGELVCLLSIEADKPPDLQQAFRRWRSRALAAAGLVASILDERVVGAQIFEDALLVHDGEVVSAADLRAGIRTFLPLEVHAADRAALEKLGSVPLAESSDVARAARLYRRAVLEGPSADAFSLLWIAAECFGTHGTPSRREIEASLVRAGISPDTLPLHVGLLIGLRGQVQHQGLEDDERLRTAFYEMEAIVRSLIRQRAQLGEGWWPSPDNAAAFAEPFDRAVAEADLPGDSVWHESGLPRVSAPQRLGLPRKVNHPIEDPRLNVDPAVGPAREFIAAVLADALEWHDPNGHVALRVGRPDEAPAELTSAVEASLVWLAPERLHGLNDETHPELLVNLVWDLYALVAEAIAMADGLVGDGEGVAAIEAVGSWAQFRRLVVAGEFDESILQIPASTDLIALGKLAGWTAAGSARAAAAAESMAGEARQLIDELIAALRASRPGAPIEHLRP